MSRYSFKFLDARLNRQLVRLLKAAHIEFSLEEDGTIRYSATDEEAVENELIKTVRDQQFPQSWQIISCPEDWAERYRQYMQSHRVPFHEECIDGHLCFVLPRKFRPHSWKLEEDRPARRQRSAVG